MADHMEQIDRDRLNGDLVMMLQRGGMMSDLGEMEVPDEAEWIAEELSMLDPSEQMFYLISELAQYRMAFHSTMLHLYWDKIIEQAGVSV